MTLFDFNYGYKSRYNLICIDSENNIIILCIIVVMVLLYLSPLNVYFNYQLGANYFAKIIFLTFGSQIKLKE